MSTAALTQWITQTWWPFVQSASVASLLVLVLVSLVWMLIRRRASAHLGYALFSLPLIAFVLPLHGLFPLVISTDAALGKLLPQSAANAVASDGVLGGTADIQLAQQSPLLIGAPASASTTEVLGTSHAAVVTKASPWALPIFSLWAGVALLLAVRWTYWQWFTLRLARRAEPVKGARLRLLVKRTAVAAGIPAGLRTVQTELVSAPAVCGLFRPTLLLPEDFGEQLSDEAVCWSLHHEFAHLRRMDLWTAPLQRALQIVWWFHPVLRLTNRVVDELRECACDESALSRMPDLTRRRAASALVDLIESSRRPAPDHLITQSLFSERTSLKKRIMRLVDTGRKTHRGLTPAAFLCLCATAGVGLASTQITVSPALEQEIVEQRQPVELIEETADADSARAAIARSTQWLLAQQNGDGSWNTGSGNTGADGEFNKVGVTALAIECLLASPDAAKQEAAQSGLAWLASVQDKELGLFGDQQSWGFNASHAVATRLWIYAHRDDLTGDALTVAKLAIQYTRQSQNPYGGWRFEYPPMGDNDTFVTSLMMRAIAEAKRANLEVDPSSIESGTSWFAEVFNAGTGRYGYTSYDTLAGRLKDKRESFPAEHSEYPTALAVLAQAELGRDPVKNSSMRKASAVIADNTPQWDPARGTIDGYYWMFGARAMKGYGGVAGAHWQNELFSALVPHQKQDGTWPLNDAWSGESDTVHITAVYTRALQEALAK